MEFENTEYIENTLVYEDYCRLRESVGWTIFPNAEKSLKNSLYTIAAIQDKSFDNPDNKQTRPDSPQIILQTAVTFPNR